MIGVLAATVVVAGTIVFQDDPPADDAVNAPIVRRPDACMTTRLAPPISPLDIDRYAAMLTLAAPQRVFLDRLFAQYQSGFEGALRTHMPELDALNAQACAIMQRDFREGMTRARVAAVHAFLNELERVQSELSALGYALITKLESVLAPIQLEAVEHVRAHRQRMECMTLHERRVRASVVDLVALAESAGIDVVSDEIAGPIVQPYAIALTPLTIALEHECRTQERRTLELLTWRERDENDVRLAQDEHTRRSVESIARQSAILERGLALQKQIAAMNAKTLNLLLESLPVDEGGYLLRQYKAAVYPVVHPDHGDNALMLCDALASSTVLDEAVRTVVLQFCQEYVARHSSLTVAMEQRNEQWQHFIAETGFSLDQYEPYRSDMRALRADRWTAALNLINRVRSIIPESIAPEIDLVLKDAEGTVSRAVRAAADPNDRYPGP